MSHTKARLKTEGAWEVKRDITLPSLSQERDTQLIMQHLKALPGLRGTQTDLKRQRVTVVYTQTQLDYGTVLQTLESIGFPTSQSRWSRMKANWLQFLDENGRENANAPPPPCCSNPRGIAPPRKR